MPDSILPNTSWSPPNIYHEIKSNVSTASLPNDISELPLTLRAEEEPSPVPCTLSHRLWFWTGMAFPHSNMWIITSAYLTGMTAELKQDLLSLSKSLENRNYRTTCWSSIRQNIYFLRKRKQVSLSYGDIKNSAEMLWKHEMHISLLTKDFHQRIIKRQITLTSGWDKTTVMGYELISQFPWICGFKLELEMLLDVCVCRNTSILARKRTFSGSCQHLDDNAACKVHWNRFILLCNNFVWG